MSDDHLHSGAYEPVTRVGARLRDFLLSSKRSHSLLWSGGSAVELLFQTFVIAMRRSFVRDLSDQHALVDVKTALEGQLPAGSARDDLARLLIDVALTSQGSAKLPDFRKHRSRHLLISVLLYLVRTRFASSDELGELVYAAERRLARIYRRQAASPNWWTSWRGRRRLADLAEQDAKTQASEQMPGQPSTIVGQSLKALAVHDLDKLEQLPPEPSDERATLVSSEAFRRVLRHRFPKDPAPQAVDELADRVAVLTVHPALSLEIVRSVILRDLGRTTCHGDLGVTSSIALQAQVATFVQIAEELAFYERELDCLICDVERAVVTTEDEGQ